MVLVGWLYAVTNQNTPPKYAVYQTQKSGGMYKTAFAFSYLDFK